MDNSSLLYRIHNNPEHLTQVHCQPIISTACIDLHCSQTQSQFLQAFCCDSKSFRLLIHASQGEAVTAVAAMAMYTRYIAKDHSVLTVQLVAEQGDPVV